MNRSFKWISNDGAGDGELGQLRVMDVSAAMPVPQKRARGKGQPQQDLCNLISIFGRARQGKSFLMNCLAGEDSIFRISNEKESCTQGIDISNKWLPLPQFRTLDGGGGEAGLAARGPPAGSDSSIRIGFVDAEGQGDRDVSYDANLICPILLASKCVIFNWKGDVQKDHILSTLGIMTRAAQNIATESSEYSSTSKFAGNKKKFGNLHIVFRDWQSETKDFEGTYDMLFKPEGTREGLTRDQIRRDVLQAFQNISVWQLDAPSEFTKVLRTKLTIDKCSPDFRAQVRALRNQLAQELAEPTEFAPGLPLTFKTLGPLVSQVIAALNRGESVLPSSAYLTMMRQEISRIWASFEHDAAQKMESELNAIQSAQTEVLHHAHLTLAQAAETGAAAVASSAATAGQQSKKRKAGATVPSSGTGDEGMAGARWISSVPLADWAVFPSEEVVSERLRVAFAGVRVEYEQAVTIALGDSGADSDSPLAAEVLGSDHAQRIEDLETRLMRHFVRNQHSLLFLRWLGEARAVAEKLFELQVADFEVSHGLDPPSGSMGQVVSAQELEQVLQQLQQTARGLLGGSSSLHTAGNSAALMDAHSVLQRFMEPHCERLRGLREKAARVLHETRLAAFRAFAPALLQRENEQAEQALQQLTVRHIDCRDKLWARLEEFTGRADLSIVEKSTGLLGARLAKMRDIIAHEVQVMTRDEPHGYPVFNLEDALNDRFFKIRDEIQHKIKNDIDFERTVPLLDPMLARNCTFLVEDPGHLCALPTGMVPPSEDEPELISLCADLLRRVRETRRQRAERQGTAHAQWWTDLEEGRTEFISQSAVGPFELGCRLLREEMEHAYAITRANALEQAVRAACQQLQDEVSSRAAASAVAALPELVYEAAFENALVFGVSSVAGWFGVTNNTYTAGIEDAAANFLKNGTKSQEEIAEDAVRRATLLAQQQEEFLVQFRGVLQGVLDELQARYGVLSKQEEEEEVGEGEVMREQEKKAESEDEEDTDERMASAGQDSKSAQGSRARWGATNERLQQRSRAALWAATVLGVKMKPQRIAAATRALASASSASDSASSASRNSSPADSVEATRMGRLSVQQQAQQQDQDPDSVSRSSQRGKAAAAIGRGKQGKQGLEKKKSVEQQRQDAAAYALKNFGADSLLDSPEEKREQQQQQMMSNQRRRLSGTGAGADGARQHQGKENSAQSSTDEQRTGATVESSVEGTVESKVSAGSKGVVAGRRASVGGAATAKSAAVAEAREAARQAEEARVQQMLDRVSSSVSASSSRSAGRKKR